MPANTKAAKYEWTKAEAPNFMFLWVPTGRFESSMSLGNLMLMYRDDLDEPWYEVQLVGPMPWIVAQNVTGSHGYNIETWVEGSPPANRTEEGPAVSWVPHEASHF